MSSRGARGFELGNTRGNRATALDLNGGGMGGYEEVALIVVAILGWVLLMRFLLPRLGVST